MNKEEIIRKEMLIGKFRSKLTYIFTSTDLEDIENIIDFYEQKVNQLETDKTHLIEIISGLINYVKDTYNEDLTDKTAEVMEIVLDKVGASNE